VAFNFLSQRYIRQVCTRKLYDKTLLEQHHFATNEQCCLNDQPVFNTVLVYCHFPALKAIWFTKFTILRSEKRAALWCRWHVDGACTSYLCRTV